MLKSTFWTQRRFAGIALMLGCVLFLAGAGLPVTDRKGTLIYQLPPQQWLGVVFTHPTLWWCANVLFMGGTLVTLLGFAQLTTLLRGAGDQAFSYLGLVALGVGAVLMVIFLAFRLGVDPLAAQETASTGVVPAYYLPLTLWTMALFRVYTFLAFSALALYGGAVLVSRVLPRWLGWTAIAYGLAGLGLFAYVHDLPPFLHHLVPMVMGILLLLRRYQLPPTARHREEESAVASMTAAR